MKKDKLYQKLAILIFTLILKLSKRFFNRKIIQRLVRRFENAYWKDIAKAVGLFLELSLVILFYNWLWLALSYIKGFENDLVLVLVNILASLQLVVNKYQRNLQNDILKDKIEKND